MPYPTLSHGLIRISEYRSLSENALFSEIERFSDNFVSATRLTLRSYGARWVRDPLHQWSRQWEYPFVLAELGRVLQNSARQSITVLDAGSGITFFPYYLEHKFDHLIVQCADTDESLVTAYNEINKALGSNVKFQATDIGNIEAPDESFDVIYCISVLEHTKNYRVIIDEFNRLLRPKGRLILTFDVALDGNADIPIDGARDLLATLDRTFKACDGLSVATMISGDPYFDRDVLTTEFIKQHDPSLLPWKYPRLSGALASISRGRLPRFTMKRLACSCHVFEKSV